MKSEIPLEVSSLVSIVKAEHVEDVQRVNEVAYRSTSIVGTGPNLERECLIRAKGGKDG